MSDHPSTTENDDQTPEQLRIRREKRDRILDEGREAYPVSIGRTHSLAEIREAHPELCLLYTSPSPRDVEESRMPSSA